jgi:hypothetical protein
MKIQANLDLVDRGEISLPTANSFKIKFCTDPSCGPHFVLYDKDDEPFCEMVMSQQQFLAATDTILDHFESNDRSTN